MRRHFTNVRSLLTFLKRLLMFVKWLFSGEKCLLYLRNTCADALNC